ncbi:hypothetical protein G7059_01800 [Erysipelothrix sp. HDW6A]|uniref:DUF6751 family protein n=1 Tax=Erysipelothrix sp. HDW6A TaxID=2714928 RepID=UPI00140E41D5|nr:DUF6751 family protein [Erysipelothrix sp. HDW6A]QIK56667.1 hypothetical protein G7059_01800 [Erysipelothrix sp. HDW6A]
MMLNTTITIYNLVKARTGDTYQHTIIEGVHWEDEKGIRLGDTVVKSENSISVVIPMSIEGFELPSNFQRLSDKTGKWTLRPGDVIVKGEHQEITDLSDLNDVDQKMTIASYEVNDQALMSYLNNYTANGK